MYHVMYCSLICSISCLLPYTDSSILTTTFVESKLDIVMIFYFILPSSPNGPFLYSWSHIIVLLSLCCENNYRTSCDILLYIVVNDY